MLYYCRKCIIKVKKKFYFVNNVCPNCGRFSSKPNGVPRRITAGNMPAYLANEINRILLAYN